MNECHASRLYITSDNLHVHVYVPVNTDLIAVCSLPPSLPPSIRSSFLPSISLFTPSTGASQAIKQASSDSSRDPDRFTVLFKAWQLSGDIHCLSTKVR